MNRKDVIGGVTTFLTMSYIVVVNPSILSTPGTGMPFNGVLTATVLLAFSMTLFMGLYAKLPFAVAPGMGINAFFTYTLILGQNVPWQTALGMVFWSGILFLLLSLTSLRQNIAMAIPPSLRIAAAAGIGIFLTFIGLKNMGLVVGNPATLLSNGNLTHQVVVSMLGMLLAVLLLKRKSAFAFLVPIVAITLVGLGAGWVVWPENVVSPPDFSSVFFKLEIMDALQLAYIPAILAIMFTDLFDSISTFVGVSKASGLLDERGEPKNLKQGLLVDAVATFSAGLFGTSSGTAFIESAAGIEAGGRTGKSSIVTALCFLPFFFLAPLAALVPPYATGPVLVLVGALMFRSVEELRSRDLEDLVPAFLTVVLIPLAFSITQGILWGFVSHVLLYCIVGRAREIKPMMFVLSGISALLLYIENGI